jgi:hypoxia up-regulated 1
VQFDSMLVATYWNLSIDLSELTLSSLSTPTQVLAERHYPIGATYNESRSGVTMNVDGQEFTPEELVAMVLTHAVDISVAYAAEQGGPMNVAPKDIVLTVPSFATQKERLALLDAATLADINVLTLIDETTAAALHYAMDKTFVDGEQLLLFYNMGASSLQVSLIRFFSYEQPQKYGKPKASPALEVLSKAWDITLGGTAFDHLLVEYLADQFNEAWAKTGRKKDQDVRRFPRAMTKIRIQANKIKHVLSANNDIPVHMESVHDDVPLSTHVSRSQLEEMSSELLKRAVEPAKRALEMANKTIADLTGMELIGGGMRIPRVQTELSKAFGELEIGLHINADESMALGAAFAGANISTAFRVRHVGMTDLNPFQMQVSLSDIASLAKGEDEPWTKNTVLFKSFSKLGVKKTIAFTHDRDVHCSLDYDPTENLPQGTDLSIEKYNITGVEAFAKEMEEKKLGKPKVSLQFELSSSGITKLIKAEATVEDTYTVEEEIEVDDEDAANATTKADASASNETLKNETEANTNATNATDTSVTKKKKKAEKPKKKIKVMKVSLVVWRWSLPFA